MTELLFEIAFIFLVYFSLLGLRNKVSRKAKAVLFSFVYLGTIIYALEKAAYAISGESLGDSFVFTLIGFFNVGIWEYRNVIFYTSLRLILPLVCVYLIKKLPLVKVPTKMGLPFYLCLLFAFFFNPSVRRLYASGMNTFLNSSLSFQNYFHNPIRVWTYPLLNRTT